MKRVRMAKQSKERKKQKKKWKFRFRHWLSLIKLKNHRPILYRHRWGIKIGLTLLNDEIVNRNWFGAIMDGSVQLYNVHVVYEQNKRITTAKNTFRKAVNESSRFPSKLRQMCSNRCESQMKINTFLLIYCPKAKTIAPNTRWRVQVYESDQTKNGGRRTLEREREKESRRRKIRLIWWKFCASWHLCAPKTTTHQKFQSGWWNLLLSFPAPLRIFFPSFSLFLTNK